MSTRPGVIRTIRVGGWSMYVTVCFADGPVERPWALFIELELSQEEAENHALISGLLTALAQATTVGLRAGVPLATYLAQWEHTRFPPEQLGGASSLLDALSKWMRERFLPTPAADVVPG